MTCKNPDCKADIKHQDEAKLGGSGPYLEIIVICPECGAEHYTSVTADTDLILNDR